ncbi:MAG: FliH/SctL family protein [Pseudomonadota bacterium]
MDNSVKTEADQEAPQRFLFDQSFDSKPDEARKPPEDEPPPEPTFSEDEMNSARQQAFAEGHAAGSAEAASRFDTEIAALVSAVGNQLPDVAAAQTAANERLLRDGVRLSVEIVRKLLPYFAATHGTYEIEQLVSQCLQTLIDEPRINVRVAPATVPAITDRLESARSSGQFDGRFVIEPDDALDPTDCDVDWQGGGLHRSGKDIWRQVDEAVDRFLAGQDDETPGNGDATAADGPVRGGNGSADSAATDMTFSANGDGADAEGDRIDAAEPLEDR